MTDPKPAKSRPLRRILALVAIGLVLLAALAWLNRRTLGREALTGWLKSKGVASDIAVETLDPDRFVARLRIGDPNRPDFVAERAEVLFRPSLTGIEITSITLNKPLLRASYHGGQLSFGVLDPLVREFLSRPPPSARLPRLQVDGGVLALATEYGAVRVVADALVEDSKLQRLSATIAPTHLKGEGFDAAVGQASLRAITRAGRIDLALAAPLSRVTAAGASVQDGRLTLDAQLPYPDVAKRRLDGPVTASLQVVGKRLGLTGHSLADAALVLDLSGQMGGGPSDLAVAGQAEAKLSGRGARFADAEIGTVRAAASATDFQWSRKGGDRVAATVRLTGDLQNLAAGDLRLSRLAITAAGPVMAVPGVFGAALIGSATGRGGWSGLGAPAPSDSAELATLKRAARAFRIAAPAVSVNLKNGLVVGLPKPLSIDSDTGGRVQVAARGNAPLFGPKGGALRLEVSGGGLPRVEADVARLTVAGDGMTATGRIRAQASVGMVQGGDIDASGRLSLANGAIAFTAAQCVTLAAGRLEFGANDVEALSGRLCPTGGPLFSFRNGDWRLAGRTEAVAAAAPFLLAEVDGGAARFSAASTHGALTASAHVETARLRDTSPQARFNPLILSGAATLADYLWKADLAARLPGGAAVGRAQLAHDTGLGFGFVVLETERLTFAEGGLQPDQLSPLTSAIGPPVTGSAQFKGRFDWAREGASSRGTLTIPQLDFQSAAGPVEGLKGQIAFTSLAPLVAAPGQELEINRISTIVPLTALRARFGLTDNLLRIEGGDAAFGGGSVRVENLEYPLTPGAPIRGGLIFDGVQLHDLMEASPFGERVDLDAKVSGRMTFEIIDGKVRINEGNLKSDQPGRISIDRAALTGVQAQGAITGPVGTAEAVDPNATFTDFAYQAMQHLAFDKLDATVASQVDGRLGVLFHIVGRHDPPEKQQIRITLMDLINKKFLGRKLPLPSGTGVNLTLDTTLNLDDLLADYAEYRRARGSGPVQP